MTKGILVFLGIAIVVGMVLVVNSGQSSIDSSATSSVPTNVDSRASLKALPEQVVTEEQKKLPPLRRSTQ